MSRILLAVFFLPCLVWANAEQVVESQQAFSLWAWFEANVQSVDALIVVVIVMIGVTSWLIKRSE